VKNILITGGTGTTGRRIASRLAAAGQSVRTASRTSGDFSFDLGDPTTWTAALDNTTAAYVMEPDLRAAGAERIPRFVAEAVDAGVRRIVLLSAHGVGEADDSHPLKDAEQAVRDSGADWTILRPGWFSQNFSEGFWRPAILDGTLTLSTGDGRTAFVDAEDIAEVAASALTDDRHSGETYALTGPRAISFGEATAIIAKATGRTVRHVDVDPEAAIAQQVAAGAPPEVARLLVGLLVAIRDGHGDEVSDGVVRALGREPGSFEDFAAHAAASGAWR
jgi:uncharacterized protein YbjT (DUF2867 family)